jgi:hypothetical protein
LDADFTLPAADGFPILPAGQAQDGTLKLSMDCEGLIFLQDGTFWISDEYGRIYLAFLFKLTIANAYHFSADGVLIEVITPPAAFIPIRNGVKSFSADTPPIFSPNSHPVPKDPTTGRQNNQGFEGMAISPDEKYLYLLLQSSTIQDGGTATTRRNTRLLEWDLKKKKFTGEWVVQLPVFKDETGATKVAAQSELHFLDKNRFLILARDSGHGFGQPISASNYRHVLPPIPSPTLAHIR